MRSTTIRFEKIQRECASQPSLALVERAEGTSPNFSQPASQPASPSSQPRSSDPGVFGLFKRTHPGP